MASKFFEHFIGITDAMNSLGGTGLWDEQDGFYYDQLKLDGRQSPLRTRSLVGLIPLIAVEVIETSQIEKLPGFKKRMEWFLGYREDLKPLITYCESCSHFCHRMLAIPTLERLKRVLSYMLDENEFLSPYGLRSVSRIHWERPYIFRVGNEEHRVEYVPGEGTSYLFGGNSIQHLPAESRRRPALPRKRHAIGEEPALAQFSFVSRIFPWRYWPRAGSKPPDGMDRTGREAFGACARNGACGHS